MIICWLAMGHKQQADGASNMFRFSFHHFAGATLLRFNSNHNRGVQGAKAAENREHDFGISVQSSRFTSMLHLQPTPFDHLERPERRNCD